MSPTRKRFNAFDDFPSDSQPAPNEPAAAPSAGRRPAPSEGEQPASQVERIERLRPSQMLPDRFQPRRLLPASLRPAFFSGRSDCYQTAAAWLDLAEHDSAYLMEVERLLAMGGSFDEHGQIKPVTGAWVSTQDGRYLFVIETGERRFWAACLRAVRDHQSEEPLLRVEVIAKPTRQRQVLENRHAEPPSSVSQACEVAALILNELNIQPDPASKDEYEYFRQARSLRMPAGLWDRIMPVMQLTRPRMSQLLNILQLPTPLLELADRYRLPERVLREIWPLPSVQWERMLRIAIQNNMTSEEVAELTAPASTIGPGGSARRSPAVPEPGRLALSGLRRFANAIVELDETSQSQALDEVADLLVTTHQAEGMLFLLGELAQRLDIRQAGRR